MGPGSVQGASRGRAAAWPPRWELSSKSKQRVCPGGGPPGASDSCCVALSSPQAPACMRKHLLSPGWRRRRAQFGVWSALGPGRFPSGANTLPSTSSLAREPLLGPGEEVSAGATGGGCLGGVPSAGPGWGGDGGVATSWAEVAWGEGGWLRGLLGRAVARGLHQARGCWPQGLSRAGLAAGQRPVSGPPGGVTSCYLAG